MLNLKAPPTTVTMRSPPRATYEEAMKAKTEHTLKPGGFYRTGPLTVAAAAGVATGGMKGAKGVASGSIHFLLPPGGAGQMMARYDGAEAAWEIPGGVRLAFKTAYLDQHGWTYVGPVPMEE